MEVQGRITKILDPVSGTSKAGKEWKKQTFILETEEKYNNVYPIEVFGLDKLEEVKDVLQVGNEVNVHFNVNANEWQGKYFVSLSSWKIEIGSAFAVTSEGAKQFEAHGTEGGGDVEHDDDLPF